MKTIFLFIPNYVYTADLIRTGFLAELCKDHRVVAYIPTLEYVDTYPKMANVEYRLWTLKSKRFWGYMKLLRIGLIRKFDDLLSIQVHYKVGFGDWQRKFLRAVALVVPVRMGPGLFTWLETVLASCDKQFVKDVLDLKPSIAVLCTPGFTDLESEAIIQSRKLGLKTVAMNFSWDNLTTNAKHMRATDYLVAWNEFMKAEAIKYHGYDADHVFVSGAMRFDYYFTKEVSISKEDFLRSKDLDPKLPLIALTTTSHGVYPYHRELAEIILNARMERLIPECSLLIRPHPKDDFDFYNKFRGERNVCIDRAGKERKQAGDSRHKIEMESDDLINLHATLKHADVVINYTSTITLEALACGTPVINIAFPKTPFQRHYEYVHYQPIIDSKSVDLVHNKEEMFLSISKHLSGPKHVDTAITDKFFYKQDGQSFKRCAELVTVIADKQ